MNRKVIVLILALILVFVFVFIGFMSSGYQIFIGDRVEGARSKIIVERLSTSGNAIFVDEVGDKQYDITIGDAVDSSCSSNYDNCRCIGFLWTTFGSTNRYTCFGFNFCSSIKVGKC